MEVVTVGRGDDLHAALRRADFVSLHVPLTAATRHLFDAAPSRSCRPTAILVNTARGAVVDQDALAAALHEGPLAGAALDVTDPEPLPAGHPLLRRPEPRVVPTSARPPTAHAGADGGDGGGQPARRLDGPPAPASRRAQG
jgi:phosphoglycerate dehydrogenase-like enzyme